MYSYVHIQYCTGIHNMTQWTMKLKSVTGTLRVKTPEETGEEIADLKAEPQTEGKPKGDSKDTNPFLAVSSSQRVQTGVVYWIKGWCTV
jgi:hypothetical protein